jgi:hypothetical protein
VSELPTALPFPTLPPPATETELPTALPFPTLPPPATPTPLPTVILLPLPAYASMDDGAPDWQTQAGWTLSDQAAYGGQGLGWQDTTTDEVDLLRWTRPLDLRRLSAGQTVQMTFQSLLINQQSTAEVQISLDGTNWLTVAVIAPSAQWLQQSIDLSTYVGQAVQIQFLWQGVSPTIEGQQADRWLVDEVMVATVAPADTPMPIATEIPTEASTATLESTTTDQPTEPVATEEVS